jgi:hypothetical protein
MARTIMPGLSRTQANRYLLNIGVHPLRVRNQIIEAAAGRATRVDGGALWLEVKQRGYNPMGAVGPRTRRKPSRWHQGRLGGRGRARGAGNGTGAHVLRAQEPTFCAHGRHRTLRCDLCLVEASIADGTVASSVPMTLADARAIVAMGPRFAATVANLAALGGLEA